MFVRVAITTVKWSLIALITALLAFLLTAWIGSSLPRNNEWTEPESGIDILIGSNGIHTEIAMPLTTPEMDWRTVFPASDLIAAEGDYTHIAVSWGERAFFLETPRWSEFDLGTAIGAITGGEGVLHVAHYIRPAPSADYRILTLSPDQYRQLTHEIVDQLAPNPEVLPGYDANDVFYTTTGTYHLGNTCNQWTSDRLANAGVRIGRWTPFPGGVMKWIAKLEPR